MDKEEKEEKTRNVEDLPFTQVTTWVTAEEIQNLEVRIGVPTATATAKGLPPTILKTAA